ncbi:oxygen-dependent tRNA uridine(34) hydroxylase TrhO ['Camptotheca acuminata' phytoplasma]|uniref:oxygen-dependent tRNA uridine(34) hydroxylase TrhO n=1 Tax='Camptotheca acuminata' phytoplasma TaxID=3239192 RepID=UPI00351A9A58
MNDFKKEQNYLVILYYNYIPIQDPESFQKEHLKFCQKLGLLGRIIISHEGINGTLSGLKEDVEKYIFYLRNIKGFEKTEFKIDSYHENVFPKLSVKLKDEIVSLKLEQDLFPDGSKSSYLEPKEFLQSFKKDNVVVLDVRNEYEYQLGHFKNAINPNIENFRDLPEWLENNLSLFKDKQILTYCTGGVRCEKVSLFLRSKGVEDVYQLKGGIIKYSQDKDTQGKDFQGKVYVFDKRISVPVNKKEHVIVGRDYFDQTPCERYINCANPECNKQILCSEENEIKYSGSCSQECLNNKRNLYVLRNKK